MLIKFFSHILLARLAVFSRYKESKRTTLHTSLTMNHFVKCWRTNRHRSHALRKGKSQNGRRWNNNVEYSTVMFVVQRCGPSSIITNSDVRQLVITASLPVFDHTSCIIMFAKMAYSSELHRYLITPLLHQIKMFVLNNTVMLSNIKIYYV